MTDVTFRVDGEPAPKGSTRAYVRGRCAVVVNDCKRTKPWQAQVRKAAIDAGLKPVAKPGGVSLIVTLAKVQAKNNRHALWTVKPDIDKLLRAVLDALTGVAYEDDSQVTVVYATKVYAAANGCTVRVQEARQ